MSDEIEEVTKYKVDGNEFDTKEEAKSHLVWKGQCNRMTALLNTFFFPNIPIEHLAQELVEVQDRVVAILMQEEAK